MTYNLQRKNSKFTYLLLFNNSYIIVEIKNVKFIMSKSFRNSFLY